LNIGLCLYNPTTIKQKYTISAYYGEGGA